MTQAEALDALAKVLIWLEALPKIDQIHEQTNSLAVKAAASERSAKPKGSQDGKRNKPFTRQALGTGRSSDLLYNYDVRGGI